MRVAMRRNSFKLLSFALFSTLVISVVSLSPALGEEAGEWLNQLESAEKMFLNGDVPGADSVLQKSLASAPDDASRAMVLNHTGVIELKERRFKDAEKCFSQSLEIRKRVLGPEAPKTLETLSNYALASYKLGDEQLAEKLYTECIALKRKACPGTPSLAITLTNLAHLYGDERRCADAKKLYLEVIDIDTKALGENNEEVAKDMFHLGGLLHRCNECTEALPYFEKAIDKFRKAGNKLGAVQTYHYLALCQMEDKNFAAAQSSADMALVLSREIYGEFHPDTLLHMLTLADAYASSGVGPHGPSGDSDKMKAERLYNIAVEIAEHSPVPASNLTLAQCNLALAQFYRKENKSSESEKYFKQALAYYDKLNKKDMRSMYEIPLAYSHLLKDLNRTSESEQYAHRYLHVYAPGGTK